MTRFEKDVKEIQEGNEIEVLKRRKVDAKRTDSEDSVLYRNMKEDWLNMKNWMP